MSVIKIDSVKELVEKAGEIRRKLALGTRRIGNVHIGGPLSATDVAVALYYKYLEFDPDNLEDPHRNQFILSKGHNGILLFTIFCDMGMYEWDLLLDTYNTIGHPFGAHPNHTTVKGIEVSTGSLGHGLSWSCGIATANRDRDIKSRVFTLLGDGEMEEGSNWRPSSTLPRRVWTTSSRLSTTTTPRQRSRPARTCTGARKAARRV